MPLMTESLNLDVATPGESNLDGKDNRQSGPPAQQAAARTVRMPIKSINLLRGFISPAGSAHLR